MLGGWRICRPRSVVLGPPPDPDFCESMNAARRFGGSILLAGALVLSVGSATAQQAVCPDPPGNPAADKRVLCEEDAASTDNIVIRVNDFDITAAERSHHGVVGSHGGNGDIDIRVTGGKINVGKTPVTGDNGEAWGIAGIHQNSAGHVRIYASGVDIDTQGEYSYGVHGLSRGPDSVSIDVRDSTIDTAGDRAHAVFGWADGASSLDIDVTGGSIDAAGYLAVGVYGYSHGTGNIDLDVRDAVIVTRGLIGHGVFGWNLGDDSDGLIDIALSGRASVTTYGDNKFAVLGWQYNAAATKDIRISLVDETAVRAHGAGAGAVYGRNDGTDGDIDIDVYGSASVTTNGADAHGIYGRNSGTSSKGDVDIDVYGSASVTTNGADAHGIYGLNSGTSSKGDIDIDVYGSASVTTNGAGAHGIYTGIMGRGPVSAAVRRGASVRAAGANASGVQIGRLNANPDDDVPDGTPERVAGFGADGYRKQTVTVNGRVTGGSGEAAAVYLAGGGKVVIGPQGSLGAASGIAILATGDVVVPGTQPCPPGHGCPADVNAAVSRPPSIEKPRLHVAMTLGGRPVGQVIGDGWILNDGGETTITVNGVKLHDGATGATGRSAPNGAWDVTVRGEGVTVNRADPANWVMSPASASTIADRDFSAADFEEVPKPRSPAPPPLPPPPPPPPPPPKVEEEYAPRTAVYEALPGFLLRLDGIGRSGERRYARGFPAWVRISGGRGSFSPSASSVGARYSFDRHETAAGLDIPLAGGLTAGLGLRRVSGAADVSAPTGGGGIGVEGRSLAAAFAWRGASGVHAAVSASMTGYDLDLSSSKRGTLARDVEASVRAWSMEAGRRFGPADGPGPTVRAWLDRSMASMKDVADIVDSRLSFADADRTAAGAGVAAETRLSLGGGRLSLGGSLGAERMLSGGTVVLVSGERLTSRGPDTRLLLGLGAEYRMGGVVLAAGLSADGPGSGDRSVSSELRLTTRF